MRGWQDFHVQRDVDADTAWLTVYGQVDIVAAERFDAALGQTLRAGQVSYVVVNLRGCGFLDSSGIRVLCRAEREARARGKTLECENATGIVRDALDAAKHAPTRGVRVGGPQPSREASSGGTTLRLVRAPDSAGAARAAVRELLRGRGLGNDSVDRSALLVSELVTNAVEHGSGQIAVAVDLSQHDIHIEVCDDGAPFDPVPGLGMRIIERFSTAWGVSTGPTTVWCDTQLQTEQSR
jgi:anti-anti-sigma factor